jgi:hypothetical protein
MTEIKTPPTGYLQDAAGRLVPIETIKPIDLARDQLVNEIFPHAVAISRQIAAFKAAAFADIAAFVQLSAEEYDVHIGGDKGNVTLLSFDGRYKIQRAIAEQICFDERLQAAKGLIDECITAWSDGARVEIRVLVNSAFQVDKEGKINTARVLCLRRLEITDDRWRRAMKAISDAVMVIGSKSYIRVYERDGNGQYQPIALDVAGA